MTVIPDFDENKLSEWQIKHEKYLRERIERILDVKNEINGLLDKIKANTSNYNILKYSNLISEKEYLINVAYSELVLVRDSLGIITVPYDDKLTLADKFQAINTSHYDIYLDILDKIILYPVKGTYAYCECKEYDSLTRAEIGKLVKKALREKYPDIKWSVTTEESYFSDYVRISANTAPSVKEKYGSLFIGDDFLEELQDYLKEFNPRATIIINTKLSGEA